MRPGLLSVSTNDTDRKPEPQCPAFFHSRHLAYEKFRLTSPAGGPQNALEVSAVALDHRSDFTIPKEVCAMIQTPTITEVFKSYCMVNADLAENTLAHTQRCLNLLSEFLLEEKRHSLRVREVNRDDISDWRGWMIRAKDPEGHPRFKPSTVNSYLKGAAPLFNWCLQRLDKLVDANPFHKIKFVEEDIPVYEYTREEVQALVETADVRWRGMIVLACSAGLSRGEVLNLIWEDLDCDRNRVWVRNKPDDLNTGTWQWKMKRRGKEKRPVELPMSTKMGSVLMEIQSGPINVNQPYPFLLPRRYWELRSQIGSLARNVRNCPDANFDGMFRSLCRQAGIERGERDFHDLRKTAITNWTRTPGLAPQDVQALARHASLQTTMRYMAINPAAAQIAERNCFV